MKKDELMSKAKNGEWALAKYLMVDALPLSETES